MSGFTSSAVPLETDAGCEIPTQMNMGANSNVEDAMGDAGKTCGTKNQRSNRKRWNATSVVTSEIAK